MARATVISPRRLWWLLAGAFALRVAARLARGEAEFLSGGYAFYLWLARGALDGHGFCGDGGACLTRMPLYTAILTPFVGLGVTYPGVPILGALAGTAMVWMTYRLAAFAFDGRTAAIAAAGVAFSPYAVVHDTALQETAILNALFLLTTCVALGAVVLTRRPGLNAVLLGVIAALTVLTSARVAFVVPVVLAWASARGTTVGAPRWRRAALIALPIVLLLGGWMVRNWAIAGVPVLTTESGTHLWRAYNPVTFDLFPKRSMDDVERLAMEQLTPEQAREWAALGPDPLAASRVTSRWAFEYVAGHPWGVFLGVLRKLEVVAVAELSPSRGRLTDLAYAACYAPVHVLAVVGLCLTEARRVRELFSWLLAGFLVVTAVYWAHTSHTSLIEPLLIVLASATAARVTRALPGIGRVRGALPSRV